MNALRLPKAENGASQSCCNIAISLIMPHWVFSPNALITSFVSVAT